MDESREVNSIGIEPENYFDTYLPCQEYEVEQQTIPVAVFITGRKMVKLN